ncbi:hypothetical protein Efla_005728 [Eimeria flavescens]
MNIGLSIVRFRVRCWKMLEETAADLTGKGPAVAQEGPPRLVCCVPMIPQGPPRPTLVRYGPCIEVGPDAPEAIAAAREAGGREECEDRKEAVERILREAQGSRVPVEAILDALFPPLVWQERGHIYVQAGHVSTAAADRVDVLKTREDLDIQLLERRASETGVCPCRYDAVLQCFDREYRIHFTNHLMCLICLLFMSLRCLRTLRTLRVKDEIKLTIAALEVLCRSSISFSALKQIESQASDTGVTQQQARPAAGSRLHNVAVNAAGKLEHHCYCMGDLTELQEKNEELKARLAITKSQIEARKAQMAEELEVVSKEHANEVCCKSKRNREAASTTRRSRDDLHQHAQ